MLKDFAYDLRFAPVKDPGGNVFVDIRERDLRFTLALCRRTADECYTRGQPAWQQRLKAGYQSQSLAEVRRISTYEQLLLYL